MASTFNFCIKFIVVVIMLLCLGTTPSLSSRATTSFDSSLTIHELLKSNGLPGGLLPKEVKSYTLSEEGVLEVKLDGPCLTKYENRILFDSVVKANLSYGSLIGVVGLSQEELFLWLPVKDIIVYDPSSGLILFDIVVAHKELSLSIFEEPRHCNPKGNSN